VLTNTTNFGDNPIDVP